MVHLYQVVKINWYDKFISDYILPTNCLIVRVTTENLHSVNNTLDSVPQENPLRPLIWRSDQPGVKETGEKICHSSDPFRLSGVLYQAPQVLS